MPRFARLILHWLGLADHPDPWSGPAGDYFISDKEATISYMQTRLPPYAVEILSKALGFTLIAKINGRSFMISQGYVEEAQGSRVLRRGRNFITSVSHSAVWQRQQRSTLIRDSTDLGYWIASNDPLRGYREYFRRITPEEFATRTSHIPRDHDGCPIVTPPDEATLSKASAIPGSDRAHR